MTPYALRLARERVRLKLAIAANDGADLRRSLDDLTAQLRVSDQPDPIAALARRLGVDRRAEDFLAYALACCTDPACAAALQQLQGASSQHGAAIASYAVRSTHRRRRSCAIADTDHLVRR